MPAEVAELFDPLVDEVVWLNYRWDTYHKLFGQGPKRTELLNETAPAFFQIVHDALFLDVVMAVSRLADPPKSCGRENLSIQRLQNELAEHCDAGLCSQFDLLVERFLTNSSPFKTIRHRQIAHSDLPTALNINTDPLPGISRKLIKDALHELASVLNFLNGELRDTEVAFSFVDDRFGAEDVVHCLELGLDETKNRLNRLRQDLAEFVSSDPNA